MNVTQKKFTPRWQRQRARRLKSKEREREAIEKAAEKIAARRLAKRRRRSLGTPDQNPDRATRVGVRARKEGTTPRQMRKRIKAERRSRA